MKKEIISATKSSFYSNYDLYRKDNVPSPITAASAGQAHHYGRPNNVSQNLLKNKFQNNQNMQDGYFQGFYQAGKHQSQPPQQQPEAFFTKHELEYHQKNVVQSQHHGQFHHSQKHEYPPHKPEFNNHVAKPDFNHKIPASEFHAKPHDFHQNQAFYNNENNMQYPQQYYHNEFDLPATADGNGNAGYYDPKTQQHYYENVNYHGPQQEYHEMYLPPGGGGASSGVPAGMTAENCENFASFQQYYEHQQGHPPHHTQAPQIHPHATQNVSGFIHSQQTYPTAANVTGNMDNSNSSSDFNFLSNLANDFAPEYYQLS